EARAADVIAAPAPPPEVVPVTEEQVAVEPMAVLPIVPMLVEPVADPVPDTAPEAPPGPEEAAPAAEPLLADPLDLQIRQAAAASGYDLTRLAPAPPPPAPALPLAPLPAAAAPLAPASPVEPPPAPRPPSITMATRLRFTDWLDQAGSEDLPSLPAPSVPTEPSVMDWLRAEGPTEPARPLAPVPPGDSAKDIVDRFIQGTMPAPAKKAEFFTPQQAAKRSLEDDGLVSETLARIHAKQGNITKAIEAYQRLALKHPEKSAYFAALSKALEGGSNK
ncbi:MAG: hypothetical protein JST66_03895, partial [Bacteroidetes bacterium]|nr:hypothetical protein [Bacteroidota bacterium]